MFSSQPASTVPKFSETRLFCPIRKTKVVLRPLAMQDGRLILIYHKNTYRLLPAGIRMVQYTLAQYHHSQRISQLVE